MKKKEKKKRRPREGEEKRRESKEREKREKRGEKAEKRKEEAEKKTEEREKENAEPPPATPLSAPLPVATSSSAIDDNHHRSALNPLSHFTIHLLACRTCTVHVLHARINYPVTVHVHSNLAN
ncbi:hypothetical protein D5086_008143 [Populus alba]|uniref:Uncharacterized protein n=1 Tax=Populus alba TaxID=43335 RepID=A0ACC4CFM5_POPAL